MGIVFAFGETWGESLRKEFQKKLKHSHFQNVWKIHCVYTTWDQPAEGSFYIQPFPGLPDSQGTSPSSLRVIENEEDLLYAAASCQHGGTLLLPELPYKNNEQLLLSWTYLLSFLFGVKFSNKGPGNQSKPSYWQLEICTGKLGLPFRVLLLLLLPSDCHRWERACKS